MNNNDIVDISVEVEALNLDGIKQNLLDYVEKEAKIDINNSVEQADKSAQDASEAADEASASAEVASDSARQASESLGNYYTKSETNTLLNAKQNTLTFDNMPTSASTNPVTSGGVYTALSGKANSATTLAGYGITDGADTALSNLSSDGQMIIDSANGTISNCVLEIPQNLKLTLENNVLTLASGSVVALTGYNTYTTRTTTANITKDSWASGWYNKTALLYIGSTGTWFGFKEVSKVGSGSSLPVDNTNFDDFYLTTDYSWYEWENGTWSKKNFSYPLAIVNVDSNGVATFAKDSNGHDMIFNGMGFIGTCLFVFPNIKVLLPNGFNADGSLQSIEVITNSVSLNNRTGAREESYFILNRYNNISVSATISSGNAYYDKEKNLFYNNGYGAYTPLLSFSTKMGGKIDKFAIRQPVRTATVEMLDKTLGDVETLLAAI